MLAEALIALIFGWVKQQSKPDVSPELREQIVNIIDDLVDRIAPGYLQSNRLPHFDYEKAIYEIVYKFVWDELGMRRYENVNYRNAVLNLLRDVQSEKFFDAIEYILKAVYECVHIQNTGNGRWDRQESTRDRHINHFKWAVDKLNYRLSQNNAKYRYELGGEAVQMVELGTGLDVPKEDSSIQKQDDNQPPEHQNQSRSEFWNRKHYIIAVVILVLTALGVFFGDGILIRPLHWVWNHLQAHL